MVCPGLGKRDWSLPVKCGHQTARTQTTRRCFVGVKSFKKLVTQWWSRVWGVWGKTKNEAKRESITFGGAESGKIRVHLTTSLT